MRRDIAATALILPIAGLGVALVEVGSRTALLRTAPAQAVGQVLSTKVTLSAMASIVPTLTVGILLDLISVQACLVVVAVAATTLAVVTWFGATPQFAESATETSAGA